MTADQNPFAVVSTPWGDMPAWRANIAAGVALARYYEAVRNDSVEGEVPPEAGELSTAILDGVKQMHDAIERLESRMNGLEQSQRERIRLDEEAEEASRLKLEPGDTPDDDFAVGSGPHTGGELSAHPPVEGEPSEPKHDGDEGGFDVPRVPPPPAEMEEPPIED